MANRTILGEIRRHMIGIRGCFVFVKMTADAIGGGPSELVADVTLCAGQLGVRSCQRKSRHCGMIESCIPPVHAVACQALSGKTGRHVIHRRCIAIICAMTADAICGEAPE